MELTRFEKRVIAITIKGCAGMEPRKELENKNVLRTSKVLAGAVELDFRAKSAGTPISP
jgi:hypothetical protein